MNIEILNSDGKKVSELAMNAEVFSGKVNGDLFYEVVKMQLANRRRGTACTKTRGEVSGGGIKPWRQKGTGRARTGSNRNPLWRHGGTVFGPRPRDYSYQVPKKVKKDALKNALMLRAEEGRLKIFESLDLDAPKTRKALELFGKAGLSNALVVTGAGNDNLRLAVRNLKDFKHLSVEGINVYDILNHDELVMTRDAFEKVEEIVK